MAESWTGLKFGHPTFNCNICSSFTQRTSQSCMNYSQEPCDCEWVDIDFGVLWVKSEQKLHLKVGCPNFSTVRGSAIYPIYSDSTQRTPRSASTNSQGSCEWFEHECEILCVMLEQIMQLKVACPRFGHLPNHTIQLTNGWKLAFSKFWQSLQFLLSVIMVANEQFHSPTY